MTLKEPEIQDEFLDKKLFTVKDRPWFADITNYKASGVIPREFTWHQKQKLIRYAR